MLLFMLKKYSYQIKIVSMPAATSLYLCDMMMNVWSGPRNISTALMYSFANRGDCKVVDEPFYAHYLHVSRADHPGKEEVLQSQSKNPTEVLHDLKEEAEKHEHVFIKNMAHHSEGLDISFASSMKNIFLIREPDQMITSFMKQIPEPTLRDVAYKHQYELLQQMVKRGEEPIVIDSKELLDAPQPYLRKLCEKLGISFTDRMLEWEKGPIPEDGVWAKYWYASVHQSTGFQSYVRKEEQVPERLLPLLDECNHYYRQLIKYTL